MMKSRKKFHHFLNVLIIVLIFWHVIFESPVSKATGSRFKPIILRLWILQRYCLVKLLKFQLFSDRCICKQGKPKQVGNIPEIRKNFQLEIVITFSSEIIEKFPHFQVSVSVLKFQVSVLVSNFFMKSQSLSRSFAGLCLRTKVSTTSLLWMHYLIYQQVEFPSRWLHLSVFFQYVSGKNIERRFWKTCLDEQIQLSMVWLSVITEKDIFEPIAIAKRRQQLLQLRFLGAAMLLFFFFAHSINGRSTRLLAYI